MPAYNEEASIESAVNDLKTNAGFVDVVVVDDGSSDHTAELCKKAGWNYISLPINLGLSDAFQAGMKYACQNGYDYVVQFDADGQHCAHYIETLVLTARSSEANIVIGSRFLEEKKNLSARNMGANIISLLLKLTTGKWINDPTSGMRLYDKAAMKEMANKYDCGPEPDTLALLIRKGLKVTECQVSMRERTAGESYFSLHRSVSYMMRMIVSILIVQWVRK